MDIQTIDELVGLAEIAEDKQKIALIDLLRLVVLNPKQAEYVFDRHWSLIDVCVIGYVSCLDLKDKDARVTHNYHLACFKFLMNAYQTTEGKRQMRDEAKSISMIQFCTRSFASANQKTVQHAAMCMFNHMLCFEGEMRSIKEELHNTLKAISEVLSDASVED